MNVGVRFDYQQAKNLPSTVPANPVYPDLLPAVQYGGRHGIPDHVAPGRAPGGSNVRSGKRAEDASSRVLLSLCQPVGTGDHGFISAFPGTQALYYTWTDPNGNHHVDPGEIDTSEARFLRSVSTRRIRALAVSVNQIAKDFKPATTDEFIVGASGRSSPDLSAALAYTYRSVRNTEFIGNSPTFRSSARPAAAISTSATRSGSSHRRRRLRPEFRRARTTRLAQCPAHPRLRRPLWKTGRTSRRPTTASSSSSSSGSRTAGRSARASPTTTGNSTSAPAPSSIRTTWREA